MRQWLLSIFHIFFGVGIYYLIRHYLELETIPLHIATEFAIAGIALWLYGAFGIFDSVGDMIKEWKNGQS